VLDHGTVPEKPTALRDTYTTQQPNNPTTQQPNNHHHQLQLQQQVGVVRIEQRAMVLKHNDMLLPTIITHAKNLNQSLQRNATQRNATHDAWQSDRLDARVRDTDQPIDRSIELKDAHYVWLVGWL
jgi:hypothetical protein